MATDEVLGYRIVAVRLCAIGEGICSRPRELPRCADCNGDGTRTVDTGITVERTTVEVGVYDLAVWREVPE